MNDHCHEVHTLLWRGVTIEVTYKRLCLRNAGYDACHVTLTSITPSRCPLPVTETGYASHFVDLRP